MTLFDEVVQQNIPHASHESDLYIPINELTTALLKSHQLHGTACVTTFWNQVEGGMWYDVAFQYQPYWQGKVKNDS